MDSRHKASKREVLLTGIDSRKALKSKNKKVEESGPLRSMTYAFAEPKMFYEPSTDFPIKEPGSATLGDKEDNQGV